MMADPLNAQVLQQWIARQQMVKQLAASMGGMPQAPSGIEGASQMLPGVPSIEGLSPPSLMEMMGGPMPPAPPPPMLSGNTSFAGQDGAMPGSMRPPLQSLMPPPMAQMGPIPKPMFPLPSPQLTKQRAEAKGYTIKKGDSLSRIAKRNGTTVKALLAKNPQIKDPDTIYVGDHLVL